MPRLSQGMVKEKAAAPSLLAFLDPFTTDVYVYTLGVFFVTALSMFVLGRFSPNQWDEGENEDDEYTNCFTMLGCFWFAFGHFLGQGSDLTCKAINIRFVASFWFFFALIMIASYTANLAAFLTVETLDKPIESAEDLAAQGLNPPIKYGVVGGGSTMKFFQNSKMPVYQTMW